MTLLNFTPEYGKLKITAFTVKSLSGPRVMEGYAHMLLKPEIDVARLFRYIGEQGLCSTGEPCMGTLPLSSDT